MGVGRDRAGYQEEEKRRGVGGNRTHDEGFADPCLSTWRRRRTADTFRVEDSTRSRYLVNPYLHFERRVKLNLDRALKPVFLIRGEV
jgi:hypothetical protein